MYKRINDNRWCFEVESVPEAAKVADMLVATLDRDENLFRKSET